jgi:hypothetical protein
MLKNYTREHRSIKVKVMCYMTDGHVQSYEQLQIKTTLNIIALVQDRKNYLENRTLWEIHIKIFLSGTSGSIGTKL